MERVSVNGVRVETRLAQKVGAGDEDWAAQAYVWQPNGEDALAAPAGQEDALGTEHDVPSAARCWACHGGRKSFVLGFSAVQLAYEAEGGLVDLDELSTDGWLSEAPRTSFEVPGDDTAREALAICTRTARIATISGALGLRLGAASTREMGWISRCAAKSWAPWRRPPRTLARAGRRSSRARRTTAG